MSTTTDAQLMYQLYLSAEQALIGGAQEYQIGNRSVKKSDLADVIKGRKEWEAKYRRGGTGPRCTRIIPRDL